MLTVGSLFSGIGGFDLGLERAGMRVVWQSEIDPYASAVLQKHWPDIPNHGDIRNIRTGTVDPVDVLCGGFPCQDISNAGKRAGIDGERSGLWAEFARVISELRPSYVLVENVAALLGRGLERVLGDLAAFGFDAEWHVIPAAALNAPHLRERVFVIAADADEKLQQRQSQHRNEQGPSGLEPHGLGARRWGQGPAAPDASNLGLAERGRLFGSLSRTLAAASAPWPRTTESALRGMDDGIPARLDRGRLSCLGNAIVPQVAEVIGRAVVSTENGGRL